jgi:hypothetical protein
MGMTKYCSGALLFFALVPYVVLPCQDSTLTKIVRNSTVPAFKDIKYELEEDVEIGKGGSGNVLFYRVVDIEVDEEGNIYVLDGGLNKVHKFNEDGGYAGSFGGSGQGPGELEMASFMRINEAAEQILVKDQIKAEVFSLGGQYIKRINFKRSLLDFLIARDGALFCGTLTVGENEQKFLVCLTDETGVVLRIMAMYSWEVGRVEKFDSSTFVTSFSGFEHFVYLATCQNGFIYGNSEKYELTVVEDKFKSSFVISKDDQSPKFTPEEKREFRRFKLPSHKPFFYGLFSDEEGRVYVQRTPSRGRGEEQILVDVFSAEGDFLYQINLPRLTHKIKNGYLYAHFIDECAEFGTVKRMKISNWASLPKSKQ